MPLLDKSADLPSRCISSSLLLVETLPKSTSRRDSPRNQAKMIHINPLGRNWGLLVNWDDLGKIYAGFAISWTVILYSGVAWLVAHRNHPYLMMRNIPLAVAATSFLHLYLVKIMLAYTINGHFLCSVEFWIMSIYLPFGIALFQANQVQLLSISIQQRKLLDGDRRSIRGPPRVWGLRSIWRSLSALKKTYVFIGIGMLLQVASSFPIFMTVYLTDFRSW